MKCSHLFSQEFISGFDLLLNAKMPCASAQKVFQLAQEIKREQDKIIALKDEKLAALRKKAKDEGVGEDTKAWKDMVEKFNIELNQIVTDMTFVNYNSLDLKDLSSVMLTPNQFAAIKELFINQ